MNGTSKAEVDSDFFGSVMPKEEIGALRFLKEHPEYDGRGVRIAVFDTGVDPGTRGLQITPDGCPKMLDVLDCTGAGDVDTSEVVRADDEGQIKGVNGKTMKVNPDWTNPSGEWHVGIRPGNEIFPAGLKGLMQERRLKKFGESQREAMTLASKELADFIKSHPKCVNEDDLKWKAELESRVQILQSMMSSYKDPGPMVDCVVWHDGQYWRAALDTSDLYPGDEGKGNLADFSPLTNFSTEHQYGTLSHEDACNFVCNIYDDGNVLSVVMDAGMHGTHVAGIAAAYHPESPEFNGIAPGARILSCKIGDRRVGTMETGVGLIRAMIAAIQWNVDVINLSYGEYFALPNSGRLMTAISDLVHKHGILFVSSAGNNGSALSTIGAPACCGGAIGVAAYVSPAMAAAAHSVREDLSEGRIYTFSSRGPTVDGTLGISICCPGGAISVVPQWSGRSRQLANGTSMASPSCSGGVALLLSGLKQTSGVINPSRIQRAMENTAAAVDSSDYETPAPLTFGHGLFQVDAAWAYLEKTADLDNKKIYFSTSARRVDNTAHGLSWNTSERPCYSDTSGIFIRDPQPVEGTLSYVCSVFPVLPEDADVLTDKLDVQIKVTLVSTQDWVTCPSALLLPHRGRTFEVEVNGSHLQAGAHYAEIQGYDVTAKWRGPLFRLPITILKPEQTNSSHINQNLGTFDFTPGKEFRRFIAVPLGAKWASVNCRAGELDGMRSFFFSSLSLISGIRVDEYAKDVRLALTSKELRTIEFPVEGGRMLEICLAQYWSSLGKCSVSLDVEFHGVQILQGSELVLDGTAANMKFQILAPLRREKVSPSLKLETVRIPLRPVESTLVPLSSPRDTLPDARVIHKLTLTYKLKLQEGGKITAQLPLFNRQVYDGEMESQMVHLFDANKKLLLVSDIYPPSVTVKKGDYTLVAVLRHDSTEILKRFENLPLIVEKCLEKPIKIPIYWTHVESVRGGKEARNFHLCPGQMITLVAGPLTESLPKDCSPGYLMKGTLKLDQTSKDQAAPTKRTVTYIVPPVKKSAESNDIPEELPMPAQISHAARDAMVKKLGASGQTKELSIKTEAELQDFDEAVERLKTDYPGHLRLLTTALKNYDALNDDLRPSRVELILSLCDEIISCIDKTDLACFVARKSPDESKEGKKRSKEAAEEKEALVLALEKQLSTIMKQQQSSEKVDYAVLKPIFDELRKWADPNEPSAALTHAKFEASAKRYAEAIKRCDSIIDSDKGLAPREVHAFKAECMASLGWLHWARNQNTHTQINFPKKFSLV